MSSNADRWQSAIRLRTDLTSPGPSSDLSATLSPAEAWPCSNGFTYLLERQTRTTDTQERPRAGNPPEKIVKCHPYYLPREFTSAVLTAVYVPPNVGVKRALDDVYTAANTLETKLMKALFIVTSDFNQANLMRGLPDYYQRISCPTREPKILDYCYITIKDAYHSIALPHLGKSDHSAAFLLPAYKRKLKHEDRSQKQNASGAVPHAPTAPDTPVPLVIAADLRSAFLRVNLRKVTGPGRAPGHALRSCVDQLTEVVTGIFNLSLLQAEVPTCFKKTSINPLCPLQLDPQHPDPLTAISEDRHSTSSMTILNTGALQGCVLSPLLYSLYTLDCVAKFCMNAIYKFADNPTIVERISDNDESEYRKKCLAQQRLFFLRWLRKFSMSTRFLTNFYRCTIENRQSGCIMAWDGNCSAQDYEKLQKVACTAQTITQANVPSMDSNYTD
eukprot:g34444.t1